MHRFRRDDPELTGGQLLRIGRRPQVADDLAGAGEAQSVRVDRHHVVVVEVVSPDLDVLERCELGREQ